VEQAEALGEKSAMGSKLCSRPRKHDVPVVGKDQNHRSTWEEHFSDANIPDLVSELQEEGGVYS
jgi:hypothetical protein